MFHLNYVALAAFTLSVCFVPATVLGKVEAQPQKSFSTAEEAAQALADAYKSADLKVLEEILGPKGQRLVSSGDPVLDRLERDWFLSLYDEGHEIMPENRSRAVLQLGKDEQPYPIPIVKREGKWYFAPSEGHEELLSRRMSKNELSALNVVVAYVEAQKEYHQRDQDGDGVLEYAQRWLSTEGKHDGLYWKGKPGESESPILKLGEVVRKEGYAIDSPVGPSPYRG